MSSNELATLIVNAVTSNGRTPNISIAALTTAIDNYTDTTTFAKVSSILTNLSNLNGNVSVYAIASAVDNAVHFGEGQFDLFVEDIQNAVDAYTSASIGERLGYVNSLGNDDISALGATLSAGLLYVNEQIAGMDLAAFQSIADQANTAVTDAQTASGQAMGYASDAGGSAMAAGGSANDASNYANDASGYANDASNYASAASGYANDASGYANDASGYANDASNYANDAANSATEAQTAAGQLGDLLNKPVYRASLILDYSGSGCTVTRSSVGYSSEAHADQQHQHYIALLCGKCSDPIACSDYFLSWS
jgi:hypothetical protein